MANKPLTKELQEVRDNHISRVDKLYRMCAGLSSELISFDGKALEIEVRHSGKWKKEPHETASQLAKSWRRNNLLSKAKSYRVHIYLREVDSVTVEPTPKEIKPGKELDSFASSVVSKLKANSDSSRDKLIATIQGNFED